MARDRNNSNRLKAGTLIGATLALASALAWGAPPVGGTALSAQPDQKRQRELINLVRQDCGSCHGLLLAGGLGPPLLPESLRDKPFDALSQTILFGRPGTPMPPWRPFLSDAEAAWVIHTLLKGLPDAP